MIPASEIAAGTSLLHGGPKYARYEIEAGMAFSARADAAATSF